MTRKRADRKEFLRMLRESCPDVRGEELVTAVGRIEKMADTLSDCKIPSYLRFLSLVMVAMQVRSENDKRWEMLDVLGEELFHLSVMVDDGEKMIRAGKNVRMVESVEDIHDPEERAKVEAILNAEPANKTVH